jgi:hypothetical protein
MSHSRNILPYAPVERPRPRRERFVFQVILWAVFIAAGLGTFSYLFFAATPR